MDEEDIDLHVLAEPQGTKSEEFAEQALEAIGRSFSQDRLSLTGGLNRALNATHHTLSDWNRRSLDRDKVAIGISLVALRGRTAHLVQLGSSVVFYRHNGVLSRLTPLDAAVGGLGEAEQISPEIRPIALQAGDVLLAASPAIESIIDIATLEGLLGRGTDDALAELYLLTRNLENFALFLIACFEADAPEPAAAVPEPDPEPEDPPEHEPSLFDEPRPRLVAPAPPPLDISRPVVRLRNDQPAGREYTRGVATSPRRPQPVSKPLLFGGLGLAALIIAAVLTVPGLVRENRAERTDDLQAQASAAYAAAQAETNADTKRALLEETRRLAGEIVRIDPENTVALDLRDQATAALSALAQVFDLGPMATVATLSGLVTGEIRVERIVVAGDNVFMLDASGGRVIGLSLTAPDAATVLYQDGETYGDSVARAPLYISWDTSVEGGRLLILDNERKLFTVTAGATALPLPIRRASTWASFTDLATYDGNVYVLDPAAGQVHRYLPAAEGFDSEPGPALAGNPDLTGAIDLAVSSDIYVLATSGAEARILRFSGGIEAPFPLSGLDRPLVSPTSLTVLDAAGEILIADTGNKRIVVTDREGNFRRQLVSNAFIDLRAIGVDAAGGQLYAVAGDMLVTAPLVR
jgi:hypothetical protein